MTATSGSVQGEHSHASQPAENKTDNGPRGTIDPLDVARFSAIAAEWWDPNGKFRPLHQLNPLRLTYIRDTVCKRLGRDPLAADPLQGLTVVDVGCGGGLLAEPISRMGANVLGIDASERNVMTAQTHATETGAPVRYQATTAEDLAATGAKFDVVISMEVIEHVADVPLFVRSLEQLLAPGGVLFLATLNRTPKSYAMAIIGAEYILRWLPVGTHNWRQFMRPSEMVAALRQRSLAMKELTGVTYNPFSGEFRLNQRDLDVNYMGWAERD
jgi:2-polyprenyl-6-hydroxyphenyl methylase/3-demethylubiquinone-9 3-methyltransferase